MFKGNNTLRICPSTMREIVQKWLDDNLGRQAAPVVTKVTMRGGYLANPCFEINVRGESDTTLVDMGVLNKHNT